MAALGCTSHELEPFVKFGYGEIDTDGRATGPWEGSMHQDGWSADIGVRYVPVRRVVEYAPGHAPEPPMATRTDEPEHPEHPAPVAPPPAVKATATLKALGITGWILVALGAILACLVAYLAAKGKIRIPWIGKSNGSKGAG